MTEKIIRKNEYFTLVAQRRRNPNRRGIGHIHYTIRINWWVFDLEEDEQVRNIVDPTRSIGGRTATSWQFRRLEDAERIYTMLLLKWS